MGVFGQSLEEIERSTVEVDHILDDAKRSDGDNEREQLAQRSLSMARSLHYEGGIIRSSILMGEICARSGRIEEALQYYLEAEAKVQSTGNKSSESSVNNALGDLFLHEKMYSNARRYYGKLLLLQPQNNEIKEKMADACLTDMQFDSAEFFYKQLIIKYKEDGNNPRLISIYQKIANAYDQFGDPGKCLYYYLPIEDLIERFGNLQERAILYNNMGRQYAALRNYTKALVYFKKAELQCVYAPCEYQDVMYANMGIAYHNTGDSKLGIEYLLKARMIVIKSNDKEALANLEHLTATVYLNNNDLYNALSHKMPQQPMASSVSSQYATNMRRQKVGKST